MIGTYPKPVASEFDIYRITLSNNCFIVDRFSPDELENFFGQKSLRTRKVKYNIEEIAFFYATDLNEYTHPDSFYEELIEHISSYLKWAEWHLQYITSTKEWDDLENEQLDSSIASFDKWQAITVDIKKILTAIRQRND